MVKKMAGASLLVARVVGLVPSALERLVPFGHHHLHFLLLLEVQLHVVQVDLVLLRIHPQLPVNKTKELQFQLIDLIQLHTAYVSNKMIPKENVIIELRGKQYSC